MVGDLTGDALTEIVVKMLGSNGWQELGRDLPDRPARSEPRAQIPYAVNELDPLLGTLPFGVTVSTVGPDVVSTSVVTCEPSCSEDLGTRVDWHLDRSGSWILRPAGPPPPRPAPVVDPPSCDAYGFNDQYPIRRCDEGYAVLIVQSALITSGTRSTSTATSAPYRDCGPRFPARRRPRGRRPRRTTHLADAGWVAARMGSRRQRHRRPGRSRLGLARRSPPR